MINPKHYKLIANLLDIAHDEFANRSCNDYELEEILPNIEDRYQLVRDIENWNDTPEEFDPDDNYDIVSNTSLLGYFSSTFKDIDDVVNSTPTSLYQRCYQELFAAYTILGDLLISMNKHGSKVNAEVNSRIADDILIIRECLTRTEHHIPRTSSEN